MLQEFESELVVFLHEEGDQTLLEVVHEHFVFLARDADLWGENVTLLLIFREERSSQEPIRPEPALWYLLDLTEVGDPERVLLIHQILIGNMDEFLFDLFLVFFIWLDRGTAILVDPVALAGGLELEHFVLAKLLLAIGKPNQILVQRQGFLRLKGG